MFEIVFRHITYVIKPIYLAAYLESIRIIRTHITIAARTIPIAFVHYSLFEHIQFSWRHKMCVHKTQCLCAMCVCGALNSIFGSKQLIWLFRI